MFVHLVLNVYFRQMEMKPCLNCGTQVPQTPGRRQKKFCSDECRQKKWQKDQQELRAHIKANGIDYYTAAKSESGHPAEAVGLPKAPEMSPYDRYRYDIAHANSIDEIKKLVGLAQKDSELTGWQKEQVKKIGIDNSQKLDI